MPSVGWEDHGELRFEGARESPSVFQICFPFERCVARRECFVYGNYSYAELACGELGAFKRKLWNL